MIYCTLAQNAQRINFTARASSQLLLELCEIGEKLVK